MQVTVSHRCPLPRRYGFTLIELSVVMLVIAVLAAAILVGADLIRDARIRQQISQLEQFDRAATTFKLKYGCIPGDCANISAVFSGAPDGNGDGLVTDCSGDIKGSVSYYDMDSSYEYEAAAFWQELGLAGLIEGIYDGAASTLDNHSVGNTYPASTIDPSIGVLAYATACASPGYSSLDHPFNAYTTVVVSTAGGLQQAVYDRALAPAVAYSIDRKVDDGSPKAGRVNAGSNVAFDSFTGETPPALPLAPASHCAYVPAGSSGGESEWVYNLADAEAPCALRWRAPY
ncbi:MAG: type II secretion system protein [Planctomycetia bacterium]|nr:MAG: type II secretion system protein [Planctomycetia bacterium]